VATRNTAGKYTCLLLLSSKSTPQTHVFGLQVAVNDVELVHVSQRQGDFSCIEARSHFREFAQFT